MLQFTVPCLFLEKLPADFPFHVGEPNSHYDAIEFQALWLRKCRHGVVDKKFHQWLKHIFTGPVRDDPNLKMVFSITWGDGTILPKGGDLPAVLPAIDEATKKKLFTSVRSVYSVINSRNNLLAQYWRSTTQSEREYIQTKTRIITKIADAIRGSAHEKLSDACRQLLLFVLSHENRSLGFLLKNMIDSQQVANLTYGLAQAADWEGKLTDLGILKGFHKFMDMAQGDQLLAMVELRDVLEHWAMSDEMANDTSYDLTDFRNDLREYFLPQQWKGKKKPSARQMFTFATELSDKDGPRDTSGFLGAMPWLLKSAESGYGASEAALGNLFADCNDFVRYRYWTKKAAEHGSHLGLFNLGISYLNGSEGMRESPGKALKYFLKSKGRGSKDAVSAIGQCFMELGQYRKAKLWLDKAANLYGSEYAFFFLGEMYENGLGVPKSKATALGHYIVAGDKGHEMAQEAAERLRGKAITFELSKERAT